MSEAITIVMAVYNGELYLEEQLESILRQSWTEWRLLARDDGSDDGSRRILERYACAHPDKIRIMPDDGVRLGPSGNFSRLLEAATGEYIMLCDQDDVWLPEKIAVTRRAMAELEERHGREMPILVHTDLVVVDAALRTVAPSLWCYQMSDPEGGRELNRLLVQNCATGCSMLFNRALLDLALPIPQAALMHDWWLMLVTAAFGRIGHVTEATGLYRQHGRNDTGARRLTLSALLCHLRGLAETRQVIRQIQAQGGALAQRYGERLGPRLEAVRVFVSFHELGFFRKRYYILRYGFFYAGIVRNIGRLLLV